MYRKDYCGCIYGIWKQKKEIIDELLSPITKQILPASIEEKLNLYTKRIEYEQKGIKYKIIKENFLNYRLLRGLVKSEKKVVNSYIIFYSYLNRDTKGKIDFIKDDIAYLNRMQVMFVEVNKFNKILNRSYKNVLEMIKNPPSIEEELLFRENITNTKYSLSPIIIVDKIDKKYEIEIDAKIYPDVREILIKL